MNLHDIPKEQPRPIISETWEKAAGGFQNDWDNYHPIVLTVRDGHVIRVGYRNGNYNGRLQANGLSGMGEDGMRDWATRANTTLDWSLVEIISEGESNLEW